MAKREPKRELKRGGAPRKYPWDKWTDGRQHTARKGKDFTVEAESFRIGLHNQASRRLGMKAQVSVQDGGDVVVFKFIDELPERVTTALRPWFDDQPTEVLDLAVTEVVEAVRS